MVESEPLNRDKTTRIKPTMIRNSNRSIYNLICVRIVSPRGPLGAQIDWSSG